LADHSGPTPRYHLLETIRQYAADHLRAAGEQEAVAKAHARWYTDLGERGGAGLFGSEQLEWLARLDAEYDNLRAGLEWALANAHGEEALRLSGGLVLYWRLRSYWSEGRRWLESALHPDNTGSPSLRAKATWGLGFLSFMLGDRTEARQVLEEAGELARQAGDAVCEARVLLLLGNERQLSDHAEALLLYERAAASARDNADAWCLDHALGLIGLVHLDRGDTIPARKALEACIWESRRAGELQGLRVGLTLLGELGRSTASYDEAQGLLEEALTIARQLGDPYDPTVGSWTPIDNPYYPRGQQVRALQLLGPGCEPHCGKVLVVSNDWPVSLAELYDPNTNRFEPFITYGHGRTMWNSQLAELQDGRVLIVTGYFGRDSWAFLLDPELRQAKEIDRPVGRYYSDVMPALLTDGGVLFVQTTHSEIYRPATDGKGPGSWESAPGCTNTADQTCNILASLDDNRVLVGFRNYLTPGPYERHGGTGSRIFDSSKPAGQR